MVLFSVFNPDRVYEGKNGSVLLSTTPQMRPQTKHVALKYHHFQSHINSVVTKILPIDSRDQMAKIFTNPFGPELFHHLHFKLCN